MQKIVLMQKLKPTVQFISTEAMFYDFNCSEIESVPVESIVCFSMHVKTLYIMCISTEAVPGIYLFPHLKFLIPISSLG